MAADFNPYHVWLGIPPEEQPANYYRLLSLKQFETNGDVIDSAADRQMAHLRTFQSGKHGELTQRILNEVAAARVCLLDPKKRAGYDQQLRARLAPATAASPAAVAISPLAGGSAIHRQPPRRHAEVMAAAPAASFPAPAAVPKPVDQWEDLLGNPSDKEAIRPAGTPAGATTAKANAAGQRGANSRMIAIGIAAAAVLIAAVGIGMFALNGPSDGTLLFDWPLADRPDTTITVDGTPLPPPATGSWEYRGPAGPHHIVAEHLAYKLDANVAIVAGQQQSVPSDWKPKATLALDWPVALHSGAELKVDGRKQPVAQQELMEVAVEPGPHVVQVTLHGSSPIIQTTTIAPDGRQLISIRPPPPTSTKLVFDWPADQRKDAELIIDGSRQTVPIGGGSASFALVVAPGRRVVHMTRAGFEPFDKIVDLAAGENQSLTPSWTPEKKVARTVVIDTPDPAETTTRPVAPVKEIPVPANPAGANPLPIGEWVDIVSLIDTKRDTVKGNWSRNGAELSCEPVHMSRIGVPVAIDGGYDLLVEFTRTEGTDSVDVVIPVGSRQCEVKLSGWHGKVNGLSTIDGRKLDQDGNPTSSRPGVLENGHRYHLLVKVRLPRPDQASIDVTLDGKRCLPHWQGAQALLGLENGMALANVRQVGLGANSIGIRFHTARLRMVSGQGSSNASPAESAQPNSQPDDAGSPNPLRFNKWTYVADEDGRPGDFEKNATEWIELKDGKVWAHFQESARNAKYVELFDATRHIWVRLTPTDASWARVRGNWITSGKGAPAAEP